MDKLQEKKGWLTDFTLLSINKNEVNNFYKLSQIVSKVRFHLYRTPNNLKLINRYFDVMNFVFKNYSINENHFRYIKEKSNLKLKNDYLLEIIFERNKVLELLEKNDFFSFNYDYYLRPMESIFGFSENLIFERETFFNSFSKKKRFDKELEKFESLKNLFWLFVDEAIKYEQRKVA